MVRLIGLSGSLRRGSFNTAVLETLAGRLPPEVMLRVHPLHSVPLYNQDLEGAAFPAAVDDLKRAVAGADGVICCSPEYNYGMSGVLKNAIDWISRPAMSSVLKGKPVLLMSCSPSINGGARAHAQMREALSACLARVIARPQVVIGNAGQKIAEGQVTDTQTLSLVSDAAQDLVEEIRMLNRA